MKPNSYESLEALFLDYSSDFDPLFSQFHQAFEVAAPLFEKMFSDSFQSEVVYKIGF